MQEYLLPFASRWHLHPWDIDRLTLAEFDAYAAGIDELARHADSAAPAATTRPPRRHRR